MSTQSLETIACGVRQYALAHVSTLNSSDGIADSVRANNTYDNKLQYKEQYKLHITLLDSFSLFPNL